MADDLFSDAAEGALSAVAPARRQDASAHARRGRRPGPSARPRLAVAPARRGRRRQPASCCGVRLVPARRHSPGCSPPAAASSSCQQSPPASRTCARRIEEAKERLGLGGERTVLFVDEVHRFTKSQQDALLPGVESGLVTFVGATTENPFFSVISPLLSRSLMLTLHAARRRRGPDAGRAGFDRRTRARGRRDDLG